MKGLIDAEVCRRSGHWIEDDYVYSRCSECGYVVGERREAYPFCPNCGARMEPDNDELEGEK